MLDNLAPARRRLVLTVLSGLVVIVVAVGGFLVVRGLVGGSGVSQDDPGPVVMVPGYGGDVSDMDPLVAAARGEGREVAVLDAPGDGTGDLRREARALRSLVDRELRRTGAESVDLVGYSAGGVVVRYYVKELGGADVVRRVLTLGAPHHGTDVAEQAVRAAGGCAAGCEQLATSSTLTRQLSAGDETPDGPLWVTVRSDDDRTVIPTDTAELEGALNLRIQSICPGDTAGHGYLPKDPVSLAALAETIGKAEPTRPSGVDCG